MCGLALLIDLPRTLEKYQESELAYRPVQYDEAGWPVHPDSKERSVRVLTKYVFIIYYYHFQFNF